MKRASRLIDMDEVARFLATTARHVRRLVQERRIPFIKVGKFIRFDEDEIHAWVDASRVPVGGSYGDTPGW
ncbi:MAG: helix-turn-helix domain-containing protein [Acidimicrobiales bacterium]